MKNGNGFLWLVVASLAFCGAAQAQFDKALPKKPPVPKDNPLTRAKIELGKKLYFDPRLSSTGTVSCNSCHNVMASGTDNLDTSFGVNGKRGGRNSPTVWNAAYLSAQFWDGRAALLEDQAKGPLVNPVEMGMDNHDVVVQRISAVPGYVKEFKKAFGGSSPVTIDNVAKAIASYERTLITPNSPYDRWVRGKKSALSAKAKKGMEVIQKTGCLSCHSGPMFAGPALPMGTAFYQKFPLFTDNAYVKKYDLMKDTGRHEDTKNEAHKHMWRVPTWRNIALTAPYFHNGSVKDLDEAVRVMAKTQLNKTLKDDEVEAIVAFLESLTGEFPEQKMPRLPMKYGEHY